MHYNAKNGIRFFLAKMQNTLLSPTKGKKVHISIFTFRWLPFIAFSILKYVFWLKRIFLTSTNRLLWVPKFSHTLIRKVPMPIGPQGILSKHGRKHFLITHLSTGTKKSSNSVLTVGVGVVKPVVKWHKCQKPQCPTIIFVWLNGWLSHSLVHYIYIYSIT